MTGGRSGEAVKAENLLISVVVPTHNRLAQLKKVLAALEKQSLPRQRFEVIVVSDGATDGTNDFLCRAKSSLVLRPVVQANLGVSVARNVGVRQARAPLVLFIDDDVVPEPQLLSAHLARHVGRDEAAVVIGPMLSPPDAAMSPWVRWEQSMLLKQYRAMMEGRWQPTARQFYTGNASLPLSLLREAGGFDGSFRRAEDVELAYRLADKGVRFVFAPEAIAYHFPERSYSAWLDIASSYGRNDVVLARHKGHAWLLETTFREFAGRHRLIRLLVGIGLDRPLLSAVIQNSLRYLVAVFSLTRCEPLVHICLSGVFNLRYYQGMCDQLQGRENFFTQARSVN